MARFAGRVPGFQMPSCAVQAMYPPCWSLLTATKSILACLEHVARQLPPRWLRVAALLSALLLAVKRYPKHLLCAIG